MNESATETIRADRGEAGFDDYKRPYSQGAAEAEANRCLYCLDAPCVTACPTSIDIPTFIRKIATGNVKGSAKTIFSSNILGMSCARVCPVEVLCVGDCVFNEMDRPPIQVGKLQRYATDMAFGEGWRYFEAAEDSGKSVALVGGGPASLACAHELRRHGHACTVYEKRDVLGGLNTTGIAPYKMQADRSTEEVDWIKIFNLGGYLTRIIGNIETGSSSYPAFTFEQPAPIVIKVVPNRGENPHAGNNNFNGIHLCTSIDKLYLLLSFI